MKALISSLGIIAFALWLAVPGLAYYAHGQRWRAGSTIAMHLHLGSSGALIDGSRDWNAVTEAALSTWNGVVSGVSFTAVPGSTSGTGLRNNINNVIFADDVYGDDFGDAIAVARWSYRISDNSMVEADIVFDRGRNWNSYRGSLRAASGGGTLLDLRRVALHEFGHVLGLGHPDERGQTVAAIMNSRIGHMDGLQSDDVNGARSIYGGATTTAARTGDTLPAGSRLTAGQSLVSPNARYRLVYQADGNLVLYDDVERTAPWASHTGATTPGSAWLQGDGNFVVLDGQSVMRWATGTAGASRLVVQNDGNLVLYDAAGQPVWDRHR